MLIDLCDALLTKSDWAWLNAQAAEIAETPEEHRELVDCLTLSLYWDTLMEMMHHATNHTARQS